MATVRTKHAFCFMQIRFLSHLTTSSSSSSSSRSFTVKYLMSSCGLPLKSAISASNKILLDEKTLQNSDSVLAFLKSRGFSNTHIAKLISKRPETLVSRLEGNLKPKIDFLIANGFKDALLPGLVLVNPVILHRSLNFHIKPLFESLKELLETDAKVVTAVRRSVWLSLDWKQVMKPNVEYLKSQGVSVSSISKLIIYKPRSIMKNRDAIADALKYVNSLGIEPKAPIFMYALAVVINMDKSTREKKFELLKSLGWTEEQIIAAFRRAPLYVCASEKKLRESMYFYLNTMGLELDTLVSNPKLLLLSLDHRIRPRYNVLKVLLSKNLLKEKKNKSVWLFMHTEQAFKKNYVDRYLDKLPELLQIYDHKGEGKCLAS